MAQFIRQRPPAWFWAVGVLALVWALFGCVACYSQIRYGAEAMGPSTAYDRALFASLPAWYNPLYAVAVGSGLVGALCLLARSALARPAFLVSVVAVIVQFGWTFVATDLIAVKGAAHVVPFPVVILLIAVGEWWFAGLARRRGWIG